jgi:MFS family permease
VTISTSLEPQQRRSLSILFVTGLLFWAGIGILLPTLPPYLQSIGMSNRDLGITMGAFAIGLLTVRPIVGKWADTRGRKFVLLIGTVVATIAPMGYLAFSSMPLLMLVRAFHGVSIAAFATAYSTLVVDLSPVEKRGEIIGYMSLVNPIGIALGPAIGGYLQHSSSYAIIFYFAIFSGFISWLGSTQIPNPKLVSLPPDLDQIEAQSKSLSIRQILTNPALNIPALVLLLVGFPFGALHTFVPLYIQGSSIDFNPGLFYTIAAMASFSARAFIGRKSDRYGRGVFLAGSLCSYTIAIAYLSIARSEIDFAIVAILEGLGTGILIPMTIALISDRVSAQHRGQALSVCTAGLDLGIALASPLFGVVVDRLTYGGIFAIGAILAAIAIAIFCTLGNLGVKSSLRFALGRDRDYYRFEP